MQPCFLTLASDEIIPVLAIGGGLMVGVIGIVAGTIKSITRTRAREESRREIAAYVAEGSISPDDAQRILQANMASGPRGGGDRC
jgi:hypothetical protein